MHIAFPYGVTPFGMTALASTEDHVRQMIAQLLFTAAGERVNRPLFGTGVQQLVFQPNSPELQGAVEAMLTGSLTQALGDVIAVESVTVAANDAELSITVVYQLKPDPQRRVDTFTRSLTS
jgi:hypothetical protein